MANSTTINGYNSGLDIENIVSIPVATKKTPEGAQPKHLESDTTTKFTDTGQLKNAISDLQTTLKELDRPELFQKRSANTSNEKLAAATTTKDTLPGIYKLEMTQLASISKVATTSFVDGCKTTPDGTLTTEQGADDAGVAVNVTMGATLAKVRGSFNTQPRDKDVTANVINNPGDGASRLVFTDKDSGAGKDAFVQGSSGLKNLNIGSVSANGKLIPPQLDSTFSSSSGYITQTKNTRLGIGGPTLESSASTVDRVINSVISRLKTVTDTNKPITVLVEQDRGGAKDNIKKFIEAYNRLIGVTSGLTGVTKVSDDRASVVGALVGDSSTRNLFTTMRNGMVQPGQDTDVRMLADVGTTTKKDGTLEIDDEEPDKVLKDRFEPVSALLTGDTSLMKRLDDKLTPCTQAGSMLQQRLDELQNTIKSVDIQCQVFDRRVEQLQDRLLERFTAMDQLIDQPDQTGEHMAQTLSGLPGLVKRS